jgi:MoaA/NifB/PqqE/SkfB family radical SAM enzyme
MREGVSAASIAVPAAFARFRRFPMHGALLLFDRDSGDNVLCDGPETVALVPVAPRVVQFAITNRCNLACTFCSRDSGAASAWTADSAFTVLAELAAAGVLEVAFGGGEPWTFRGFADLVRRLHAETPLAVNVTTNGVALTPARLAEVAGCVGQIRLSLYDDNDWRARVAMCAAAGVRFGVNYLVTPARLAGLDTTVLELAALGCRDVLLLGYHGHDASLHLSAAEASALAAQVNRLARGVPGVRLALDVCWGARLAAVPRLFAKADCGAGSEFLVVTSDRKVMPCSFHHTALPAATAADMLAIWRARQAVLATPTAQPGCARTFQLRRRDR